MSPNVTETDEGKPVVDADGERIGTVVEVADGAAYVEPFLTSSQASKEKYGWADFDTEPYPLPEESVEAVTDEEVRIDNYPEPES